MLNSTPWSTIAPEESVLGLHLTLRPAWTHRGLVPSFQEYLCCHQLFGKVGVRARPWPLPPSTAYSMFLALAVLPPLLPLGKALLPSTCVRFRSCVSACQPKVLSQDSASTLLNVGSMGAEGGTYLKREWHQDSWDESDSACEPYSAPKPTINDWSIPTVQISTLGQPSMPQSSWQPCTNTNTTHNSWVFRRHVLNPPLEPAGKKPVVPEIV